MSDDSAATFARYRPLLFSIAYEMLGSAADAEDVVQESYLRWANTDRSTIENEKSYLTQIVTRQSLNHMRTLARRKETYLGPWLPEPIGTQDDASTDVILAESLSFAMLLVLESLSPAERAVFVLREVFDYPHSDIAEMLGKSDAAVRQLASRAREHVTQRRKRFDADQQVAQNVLGEFLTSAATGDVDRLVEMLTEDVVAYSDGGGLVSAARRPIHGADKVSRWMAGAARKGGAAATIEFAHVNALPAALVKIDGQIVSAILADVEDGKISALYFVANPEKLSFADALQPVSRV
ncbi:RNA polymerase sigma-70 factor [Smaragdicoccus niigatensis]|uniref:RNA polymerase sigma-70 factor n=1 Tax=Smaragdicoccus niigatensis TaxID=359359 RepID=UPI00037289AF|nr:RNA polymerase sigma-70 factor [Smaragdicoccus niigatensis]